MVVAISAAGPYGSIVEERLGANETTRPSEFELSVGSQRQVPANHEVDQRAEGFGYWHDEDSTWIADERAAVVVEQKCLRLRGSLTSPRDQKSLNTLLQFGLAAAFADRNRMLIHGAAVGRDGAAIAIVGGSGQGKSTLTVAAELGGWDLLGDDLAVVAPLDRRIRAVPRRPMVPAELARQFGLDGEAEPGRRGRIRRPADVLTPGEHSLIGLVIVEHGSDGDLVPLPKPGLLAFDEALAVPPFRDVLRRHLAPAAAFVHLPTVRLLHDADPGRRIAVAQENLERAFNHFSAARQ